MDEPNDVKFVLGRLDGKMDALVKLLEAIKADTAVKFQEHDKRITDLERWRWLVVGAASMAGAGAGKLFQMLSGGGHG